MVSPNTSLKICRVCRIAAFQLLPFQSNLLNLEERRNAASRRKLEKIPLGHIVSGTSNHATYDVYSPKALKTLMYLNFDEYSTLYLVQNILSFCVIEARDSKRVLNT